MSNYTDNAAIPLQNNYPCFKPWPGDNQKPVIQGNECIIQEEETGPMMTGGYKYIYYASKITHYYY